MTKQTALLAKYLALYQKKPHSKAFAPLAESYRKLGMLDSAYDVLKKGLRRHGDYTLGYIVLAHCYLDEGKDELAYSTLRSLVGSNKDNIKLLTIFARACYRLHSFDESLDAYKYILLINPSDEEAIAKVSELEDRTEVREEISKIVTSPSQADGVAAYLDEFGDEEDEFDDWSAVELAPPEVNQIETRPVLENQQEEEDKEESSPSDENWTTSFEDIPNQLPQVTSDNPVEEQGEDEPLVSHTLVDIYCAQEHYEKAVDLLKQILKKDPNDTRSQEKLEIIYKKIHPQYKEADVKQQKQQEFELIEEKFLNFLNLISKKSHVRQSHK